jgi:lauroyl/myristoyl acyltransferase
MPERDGYLRSALIPLSQRSAERYGLFHPGSGALIATDRLGILAARHLLDGASLAEVRQRLNQTSRLSPEGFDALASALAHVGALGGPTSTRRRQRLRAIACRWLGAMGGAGACALPALPYWAMRSLLNWLPRTVFGPRILAQARWYLDSVLSTSGYGHLPTPTREHLIRTVCQATSRTTLMRMLLVLATPTQAEAFLRQAEVRGREDVRATVESGGAVVACLHSEGYLALLALHARTFLQAACVVRSEMVSVSLDAGTTPPDYVARALGAQISNRDAMAARRLVRYVREGGIVTLPFDSAPVDAPNSQEAMLAGRLMRASAGPAWLAVQSGRPLYYATTCWDGHRVVVDYGEPLTAPQGMSKPERVAALTNELYARADRWVRAHPGEWTGWTFLEHYLAEPHSTPGTEDTDLTIPDPGPAADVTAARMTVRG